MNKQTNGVRAIGRSRPSWSKTCRALLAFALVGISQAFAQTIKIKTEQGTPFQRVAFVGTAVAKSCNGEVELLSGKEWVPAKVGQVFGCEQLCRTRSGSAIFQMRSSGSLVKIGANTVIRFCGLDETMDPSSLTGYQSRIGGASVRAVRGRAEFLNDRSKWQAITVNSTLQKGTTLRTGEDSSVDLFFRDTGLVARVNSNSRVTLNEKPIVVTGTIQSNELKAALLASAQK